MEKKYNNFTLVIQGPVHQNSIYGALNNYKDYTDNIVFSHWGTDKDKELLRHLTENDIPHMVVENTFTKASYNVFNGQNVYYQIYTTLAGLSKVKTEYVIKLRSDQWFGNLEPMFEAVLKNPNKYTCSNFHFRPDKFLKYHASDKVIGGRTDYIVATFKKALHRVTNNAQVLLSGAYMYDDDQTVATPALLDRDVKAYSYANVNRVIATQYGQVPEVGTIQILPGGYIGTVAEILIGTSFLLSRGIYPDPMNSIDIVKRNFHVVRVEDMTPYVSKDGSNTIEHNTEEIHDISQYG